MVAFGVVNRLVGTDGLVLPVDQDPQAELSLWNFEIRGDSLFECEELLILQNAESGEFGRGKVLVIE